MAKVDAMSLMASSAKNLTGAAASQNIRKVEGNSDSFGQYLAKRNDTPVEQTPAKKEDSSKETVFSGQPKSHVLKKKEYVSDMGQESLSTGTMNVEQASQMVTEIREMVKTELGTDDAAIDQTLKAMGITVVDLLNPDTLKAFVLQLKGADSLELLTDELLFQSLQAITDLLEDYSEDNASGLQALMELLNTQAPVEETTTPEAFADFIGKLTGDAESELFIQTETAQAPEVTAQSTVLKGQAEPSGKPQEMTLTKEAPAEEDIEQEKAGIERFSVVSTESRQENAQSEDSGMNPSGGNADEEKTLFAGTISTEKAEGSTEESEISDTELLQDRGETEVLKEQRTTEHEQNPVFSVNAHPHTQQGNIGEIAEANFHSAGRMLQALDITRQVSEQMRSSLSEGVTRLEMQLNPESLGKVLLTVSAKEGVMTATFRVQTEDARQALENQMFTLRENLEAKNIKVEAVDVQISNFDFTANSDAERQWKEKMEKKGKKKFDFSVAEEDEAEEIESSAEEVRRSVMRDRGGSIDFTA